MDPVRKVLDDDHPTSGAHLRGVSGVHQDHLRASIFRFARCDRDELVPGHIGYAFRQTVVFLHIADIQILEYNRSEPIHQLTGGLMSKVEPSVGDPFVNMCDDLSGFLPFRSSFFCFRESSLGFRKGLLVGAEEPWILDLLAV